MLRNSAYGISKLLARNGMLKGDAFDAFSSGVTRYGKSVHGVDGGSACATSVGVKLAAKNESSPIDLSCLR